MAEPILTTATLLSNALWAIYGDQVGKLTDKSAQFIIQALKGQETFPVNHDLLSALTKCWVRSISHFCNCFDSHVSNIAERFYLADLRRLGQEIDKGRISAEITGFDEQKFKEYFARSGADFHRNSNIQAIEFIDQKLGELPARIHNALLNGIPPHCPDWSSCFALLLAEEIKTAPRVFQIFTANSLATIEDRTADIAGASNRIEASVGHATDQLEQLAQTSHSIGHDVQWIVGKLSELSSINDRELLEVATFFGIFDAESPNEARRAIEQKAQELGVLKEKVVQQESVERELSQIAFRDYLTGISNRVHFHQEMAQLQVRDINSEIIRILVFIDLDSFHMVNNSYGHDVGDLILVEAAKRLQAVADERGVLLCRYGGDEFLFGFNGSIDEVNALRNLAREARAALREPMEAGNAVIYLTASAGISVDDHRLAIELSIKGADLALYRAKHEGKDCEIIFEPKLNSEVEERRTLELDLRGAVERNELFLQYLPTFEIESMAMVGFEALLRWKHSAKGLLSPARFIPLAEDVGLMPAIGEWVLAQASKDATQWPNDMRLSINVSVEQLTSDFVEKVIDILSVNALRPHRLEIEVTESVFLRHGTNAIEALNLLSALGVRVSLDNFGTGYSSLGYLRKFKFSSVKVDRAFIAGFAAGETSSVAMIRAIIAFASTVGSDVVAVGVETHAEYEACKMQGFTHVQGFWLGRPNTASVIADLLAAKAG